MGRFGNSWELTKACFRVVRKDKEMILFPIMSMIAAVIILSTFIFGMYMVDMFTPGNASAPINILLYFIMYFLLYFVMIFSNVAIVGCAMIRLRGGDPTLKDGFFIAIKKLPSILMWTAISATVGLILQIIRSAAGRFGPIIAGIIGFVWNILTYFVVPVLVFEDVGPFRAISRSKYILKKTWGEALISNLGVGLVFFLVGLLIFLLFIPLFIVGFFQGIVGIIVVGILFILVLAVLAAVSTAVNGVLMAALYRYGTTGQISEDMPRRYIENAFQPKKKKGFFGTKS